jgi:hypothetical protein
MAYIDVYAGMTVGNRCEVAPGGRRGTVMYLGEIEVCNRYSTYYAVIVTA